MKRNMRLITAAILLVLACIPYLISSIRWFINPGYIPEESGGGQIWPVVGIIILIPFWSPLVTGAICAIFRRSCGLAFIGAITPLILTIMLRPWGWSDMGIGYLLSSTSVFVYGLLMSVQFIAMGLAAILIFLSRQEFKDRQTVAERMYGPPKKWRDTMSE
jgi:hypothetical protein